MAKECFLNHCVSLGDVYDIISLSLLWIMLWWNFFSLKLLQDLFALPQDSQMLDYWVRHHRWFGRSGEVLSTGNRGDSVSIHSLVVMFICTSFVNPIGQMVCNYFNYIYSILNTAGNFPKCLFTNCISFGESWFMTPTLFFHWCFAVKLTLCLHICCNRVLFIPSLWNCGYIFNTLAFKIFL